MIFGRSDCLLRMTFSYISPERLLRAAKWLKCQYGRKILMWYNDWGLNQTVMNHHVTGDAGAGMSEANRNDADERACGVRSLIKNLCQRPIID